jgi:hypothetical protein
MLLDAQGDDTYRYIPYAKPVVDPAKKDEKPPPPPRPGTAVFDARFLDRTGKTPLYWTEPRSMGLLLDGGGKDVYPAGCADGDRVTDEKGSDNERARNRGVRFDGDGAIDLDRPQRR